MIAIRNGHSEMVDKLLDKGANIDATNIVRNRWMVYDGYKTITIC